MAAPIQKGTDYRKTFGAKAYLTGFFTTPEGSDEEGDGTPVLKEFHEIFNSGRLKPGSRLLDVGSGPTIHQLISASRFCTEIVCAEYTENNRAEIEKWVKKDPDMHDFKFFQFDVVTTTLCLEAACPDRETYSAAVRNITRLLKPGGTLALIGITNQTLASTPSVATSSLPFLSTAAS
ncbi:indolethylamine N-methyltransferase-like [Branchiostoma floridae x Branchiostoma japonicum]